ncbi:uncharacterized protein LOC104582952 isoform X3 [Brachypodium distachyon]|uniref:DUF3615 domain-containing protein n=1 Tax=Brachypodium distachyon TaxID=15368 RepID=A0A2K2DH24_BRADI|nr:uncharacterized protein LOC104582952 isoform X3 [Brachypodium distachyon]XP_024313943.1 uncharacterized protein LOC104582952 isoform X3 [Brachypodium distachyon]PNT73580.1 hypothetical protein BRADI_2g60510v3 [Brachypodium distachyon]|eukprot:XP_024313942.1 uncharacterized protein LOC104582952 isoform X3 [Brachypodium distachyon]
MNVPRISFPGWRMSHQKISRCEEERHVGGNVEAASSAQTMQEQGSSIAATSSSSQPAEAVAHDATETSKNSSNGSLFWARRRNDWGLMFYIRVDLQGSFHTYPDVGGPFQNLQEANNAIDRHLDARRVPKMCIEQAKVSKREMAIRTIMYWPDGTRKKCSQSHAIEKIRDDNRQFVQALVDNYNKDHNLFGDIAYELKDVVHHKLFVEKHMLYWHFNFMAKNKGADDFDGTSGNLFFAEVQQCKRQGEHEELVVSCFCMIKPIDNGHCYGCTTYGSIDMKHPNKSGAYTGGHLYACKKMKFKREWSDEDEETEEARIRRMYKEYDDPHFLKKLRRFRKEQRRLKSEKGAPV